MEDPVDSAAIVVTLGSGLHVDNLHQILVLSLVFIWGPKASGAQFNCCGFFGVGSSSAVDLDLDRCDLRGPFPGE